MKLAILSRDGVINHGSPHSIRGPDEWIAIDGSLEAIARLTHSGYRIAVATNQPGISRGFFSIEDLHAIHEKMHQQLQSCGGYIEAVYFCPHEASEGCPCCKPSPGMLFQFADRLGVDLRGTPFIGDSLRDMQAATQAGATPMLVRTGLDEHTVHTYENIPNSVSVYDDLAACVDYLLAA